MNEPAKAPAAPSHAEHHGLLGVDVNAHSGCLCGKWFRSSAQFNSHFRAQVLRELIENAQREIARIRAKGYSMSDALNFVEAWLREGGK